MNIEKRSLATNIFSEEILPTLATQTKCELVAKLMCIGTDWQYENAAHNPLPPEGLEKVWKYITLEPIYWAKKILATI